MMRAVKIHEDHLIEAEEDLLIDTLFLIEEIMRERGVDRTTLAKTLGVSKARLSQLLGPDSNPTVKTLARIFRALGEDIRFVKTKKVEETPTRQGSESWGESRSYPAASSWLLACVEDRGASTRNAVSNDNDSWLNREQPLAVA